MVTAAIWAGVAMVITTDGAEAIITDGGTIGTESGF